MIKQVGKKWVLFTKDGSRRLGTHDSKVDAQAQEAAIEISKHASGTMHIKGGKAHRK